MNLIHYVIIKTYVNLFNYSCNTQVLDMEEEKGDWGFKALKQMTKINFHLQKYDAMMKHYKQLLTYIKVNNL